MTILSYIHESAAKYPQKDAFLFKDQRVTYSELVERFETVGSRIREWLGDFPYPIGLYIPNHPDFAVGYYSLVQAQQVVHLVDDKWGRDELLSLVKHVHLGGFLVRTEALDTFPLLDLVDSSWSEGSLTLVRLREDVLSEDLDSSRLKGILSCRYSSGTTGVPKCMMYEERNVIAASRNWAQTIDLTSEDIVYCAAYVSHGLAFNTSMLAPLRAGATVVFHDDITPRKVIQVMEERQPTIFVAFPVLYDLMSRGEKKYDFPKLRLCVSSGTILHESIKKKFKDKFSINIGDLYGVAETGLSVLNHSDDYQSVGYPLNNVSVRIFGDDGQELPVGEVGEVGLFTESRARAYYNLPGALEQNLRGSYYLTGDIGYLNEDGKLYIKGRKTDIVDVAGKKVDPREVEDVLRDLTGVVDVAVFGVRNEETATETLAAAVVSDSNLTREQVVKYCANRLVSYKIPQIVKFFEKIPRNNNGKVLRKELQKMV